jgi:hypothetical protein
MGAAHEFAFEILTALKGENVALEIKKAILL